MITIIFAPPRTGKTLYMSSVARNVAFDRQRTRAMQNEILLKRASGFENLQTIPPHCVSANYDLCLRKFGYRPRLSRRINPFRLGFANPLVETHFNFPYECIFITEAQKYLNSRMSMFYPDWQSRWFEQHGHNSLDIWLDTQRPMLIDLNIRELAQFTEIVKCKLHYDRFGRVCGFKSLLRHIDNSGLFDKYMASGKADKSCYTEEIYEDFFDVSACYNHQSCKPKFYDCHMDEDFDYSPAVPYGNDIDGYIKYLEENDDELPQGFYRKGGSLC